MTGENENQKDAMDIHPNLLEDSRSESVPYKSVQSRPNPYPKLNKLITALYIVTDIMDKDEPIRLKLRTLGVEIISDMSYISRTILKDKIQSVMSFLDISVSIRLMSDMNFNILKKEFILLHQSLGEVMELDQIHHNWLEDFLAEPQKGIAEQEITLPKIAINIQKPVESKSSNIPSTSADHIPNIAKKQRREDIIRALGENAGTSTITEVKNKATGMLVGVGEKTLQRELVSMVKDGILNKTGEKRWSRYSLKDSNSGTILL